jgi:hypothetical protein
MALRSTNASLSTAAMSQGLSDGQIKVTHKEQIPLPLDLLELTQKHKPRPPNNGKFRLCGIIEDTTERDQLEVVISPTDYFSVRPIQDRMFEPVLVDSAGCPCSPADKYGEDPFNVEASLLPNIICLHIIVILAGERLLLTQRIKTSGTDWEHGKWSATVDEQMNAGSSVRGVDRDFFATVEAGVYEELGYACDRSEIRILSISMDSLVFAIVVDAIVILKNVDVETVRAHCELKARDGRAEIRRVIDVEWSLEALIPILCGEDLVAGETRITLADWTLTSRMAIAISLFHGFRVESTLLGLREQLLRRNGQELPPRRSRKRINGN